MNLDKQSFQEERNNDKESVTIHTYDICADIWDTKRRTPWKYVASFLFSEVCSHEKTCSLLDVGCGSGRHMEYARKLGMSPLYGCDAAQGQVDICIKKKLECIQSDVRDLSHYYSRDARDARDTTKHFDIVLCIATIQHILEGLDRAFEELGKVCAPDGCILISLWDISEQEKNSMENKGKCTWINQETAQITFEGEHVRYYRFYPIDDVIASAQRAGLALRSKEKEEKNIYLVFEKSSSPAI